MAWLMEAQTHAVENNGNFAVDGEDLHFDGKYYANRLLFHLNVCAYFQRQKETEFHVHGCRDKTKAPHFPSRHRQSPLARVDPSDTMRRNKNRDFTYEEFYRWANEATKLPDMFAMIRALLNDVEEPEGQKDFLIGAVQDVLRRGLDLTVFQNKLPGDLVELYNSVRPSVL